MGTDGRRRPDRKLPTTYCIVRAEPIVGRTAYCIGFGAAAPDLVVRSARVAKGYAKPLAVLMAADDTSVTVYLDGPDERLALLRFLAAEFRPEQHQGHVVYHTLASPPQIVISFVDVDNVADLWAVLATLLGRIDVVVDAKIEYNKTRKVHECIVDLAADVDAEAAWELLHDESVQNLIVFDSHQEPKV